MKARRGRGWANRLFFSRATRSTDRRRGCRCWQKSLPTRHGFKCTVIFSINPATGAIDPDCQTNMPGIEALDTADLVRDAVAVPRMAGREDETFRRLPQRGQTDHRAAHQHARVFVSAGQETALTRNTIGTARSWPGGFGRQVLGNTWVSHHGDHGKESTRGIIEQSNEDHPILRGVTDLWWPTDVYTVSHLPPDAEVLVWGRSAFGNEAGRSAGRRRKKQPAHAAGMGAALHGGLGQGFKNLRHDSRCGR